jgi:hypothetical protein
MSSNLWRLLTIPCILLALLLVGSPEFPALDRALANAFSGAPTPAGETPAVTGRVAPGSVAPRPLAPSHPHPLTLAPSHRRTFEVPLYVSFAALQALDFHSTRRALASGAGREGNPAMAGLVHRPAAFAAVKAATAAGVIYLAERLRTRSRLASIVVMSAVNSMYAVVVAHNYRVAGR